MNVTTEELDQLFSLLILVLYEPRHISSISIISSLLPSLPGSCALPEELHEAALHLEPDVSRQVEEERKEC